MKHALLVLPAALATDLPSRFKQLMQTMVPYAEHKFSRGMKILMRVCALEERLQNNQSATIQAVLPNCERKPDVYVRIGCLKQKEDRHPDNAQPINDCPGLPNLKTLIQMSRRKLDRTSPKEGTTALADQSCYGLDRLLIQNARSWDMTERTLATKSCSQGLIKV